MKKVLIVAVAIFFLGACKDKSEPEFDRGPLLSNVAENIILPSYVDFSAKVATLEASVNTFLTTTSFDNLAVLRTALYEASLSFQNIKMFDFGPASDIKFKASLNTYPTDSEKINLNISTGGYSLGAASNTDAVGFPAMDYLLHAGEDTDVLNRFSVDANAEETKTYLSDLMEKITSELDFINDGWQGTYAISFQNADGTDVGSSLSLMYNEMVKDLELIKNAKIGIPAGQFSGGELYPTFVEGYYSTNSKQYALENLDAIKNLFQGGTGEGLDDYMDFVAENEGVTVTSQEILAQFDVCRAKIDALTTPFDVSVSTNTSDFTAAFQEIKKLVAYFKTDVPMAIGVLINFSDTDGD